MELTLAESYSAQDFLFPPVPDSTVNWGGGPSHLPWTGHSAMLQSEMKTDHPSRWSELLKRREVRICSLQYGAIFLLLSVLVLICLLCSTDSLKGRIGFWVKIPWRMNPVWNAQYLPDLRKIVSRSNQAEHTKVDMHTLGLAQLSGLHSACECGTGMKNFCSSWVITRQIWAISLEPCGAFLNWRVFSLWVFYSAKAGSHSYIQIESVI